MKLVCKWSHKQNNYEFHIIGHNFNCTSFVMNTGMRVWISFVGCSLVSAFLYTEYTQKNEFSKYSITVNLAGVFICQFCQFCPQLTTCLTVFVYTQTEMLFLVMYKYLLREERTVPCYTLGGFLTFQEWYTKGSNKSQILMMIMMSSRAN